MNKFSRLFVMGLLAAGTFSCTDKKTIEDPTPIVNEPGMVELKGAITSDMTLTSDKKYLLNGFVYVVAPAKLTIQPGTIIKGDKASKGTLIIERGAMILAEGTAQKPIVFTSNQAKGSRAAGDWGGVIMLGKAQANVPGTAVIEGGVDRPYGGTIANDNSGILKFVRIEFSGIAFQPGNEINGLTMGGVGSGTTLDYIQVSYNGDDSFEWFGGSVNAKHLVAYANVDDMFDTDNGFSGKLQYLVGLSDPRVADVSKSNGFESDNDASGSAANPQTKAIFSNVSLFGPKKDAAFTNFDANFGSGMHIRRNSSISVYNALVSGWPTGFLLDGTATQANADNNTLVVKNTVVAGSGTVALAVNSGSTYNVANWFNASGKNNQVIADNASLSMAAAFNLTAPNFMPVSGSALLTGGSTTGLDAFFDNVNYVGAFGTTNWTADWTNFDPQNANY